MLNITDIFNTREIAIGIIVFFLIFFVIYKDKEGVLEIPCQSDKIQILRVDNARRKTNRF